MATAAAIRRLGAGVLLAAMMIVLMCGAFSTKNIKVIVHRIDTAQGGAAEQRVK